MIAYIKGVVIHIGGDFLIVENSGIGYKIFIPQQLKVKIGERIELHLSNIIKEDRNDLYGFGTMDETRFFELLTSISGVGPKSALAIMSLDSIDQLKSAIADGNYNYLTQISGIGLKTAKKMILELQDKLSEFAGESDNTDHEDLIDALKVLGFKLKDIKEHIKNLPDSLETDSEKIKYILSNNK